MLCDTIARQEHLKGLTDMKGILTPPPPPRSVMRLAAPRVMKMAALLALLLAALTLLPSQGFASNPPAAVAQSNPPDAPSSITLERTGVGFRGKGTLTASWPAVSGATKYHITYTADKGRVWKTLASEHASTSITFEIWNGNTYYVGVRAGNANGWSGWTNSLESPPIPNPLPPNMLPGPAWVSVTRGDGTLTATWAAVSGATRYRIESSTNLGTTYQLVSYSETSTSITINANNGSTYTIAVRAGKGTEDLWSNYGPISYSAPAGPYTPSPPPSPSLSAGSVSHNTATLTLSNHTGQWWYKADTGPHATCSNIAVAGSSVNLRRLTPSTQYTYTAYSNWVCNTAIATASAFTTASPPPPPRSLTVSNITATTATLTIAGHTAAWHYKATTGPHTTCQAEVGAGTSTADITGLTASTTYIYSAYSDSGCSTLLATASQFTTPASLTASSITATGATLTIAGHTAAWHYKADTAPHTTCQGPVGAGTSTADLTGLSTNTSYVYSAYSDGTCSTLLATAASFTTELAHVTNLHTVSTVGSGISATVQQGVAFTTGPNSGGYTLSSVTASLAISGNVTPSNLTLTLHQMEGTGTYDNTTSAPSTTTLDTLTGAPPTSTSFTNTVFTCSGSGCELDASTTYFVVATYTGPNGNYAWRYAASNNVSRDPSGNGWKIERSHEKSAGNDWRSWGDWHMVRVDFDFNPAPTLTASNITATTATLTIANRARAWHYKADTAPHTTCQGPVGAGTSTADLTGLSTNTSYVYSAYSDSGCSTLLATAASFTTPFAHVTNLATPADGDSNITSSRQQGVDFTTGPNSGGYTLMSVTMPMRLKTAGTGTLDITLHATDSNDKPAASVLATLSGTAPTSSTRTNTVFTCSGSGCELDASTQYFIVATLTGTGGYALTFSGAEAVESTSPSNSGWDIGLSHVKDAGSAWSSWNDLHLIRIDFTIKPSGSGSSSSVTAANAAAASATQGAANHHGRASPGLPGRGARGVGVGAVANAGAAAWRRPLCCQPRKRKSAMRPPRTPPRMSVWRCISMRRRSIFSLSALVSASIFAPRAWMPSWFSARRRLICSAMPSILLTRSTTGVSGWVVIGAPLLRDSTKRRQTGAAG